MLSSSLFLRSSATLIFALFQFSALIRRASSTVYALDTEYSGSTFFDGFDFFDQADYTHGFVTYVDEATAQSDGLIKAGAPTYIGVDYTHTYNGSADYYNINGVGRPSVRMSSQKSWTHGVFLADISHMPGGICGTWPAFWTLGPNWPYNGEIDIIEGANNQNFDLQSLHTGGVCTITGSSSNMTGSLQGSDCDYNSGSGDNSVGCGIEDLSTQSYGTGFNSIGGGVYAMQWTSDAIQVWFFPRNSIPSDISSGSAPVPANWGLPSATFNGPDCNIDSNFASHNIIIDNTFCGDFAGAEWSSSGCASSTGQSSCSVYVGSNPNAFKNAYWDFNYIKVYQPASSSSTSTSSSTTTTSASTTTSSVQTTTSSHSSTTSSHSTTTSSHSTTTSSHTTTKSTTASHTTTKSTTASHTTTKSTTTSHTTTKSTTTSRGRFRRTDAPHHHGHQRRRIGD